MQVTHTDRGALLYFQSKHGVRSLLDIGCGPGGQVELARRMGIAAKGIDGDPNVDPTILHDFTQGPCPFNITFDMGWSVEFLEHVEERYLPNLAQTFQACRILCITHALPGKSGHHHVNLKPKRYWIDWFKSIGFSHDPEATVAMRAASTMTREFIQQTGMVLVRDKMIDSGVAG
jgi:SAM-dependent methyltransferase